MIKNLATYLVPLFGTIKNTIYEINESYSQNKENHLAKITPILDDEYSVKIPINNINDFCNFDIENTGHYVLSFKTTNNFVNYYLSLDDFYNRCPV